MRLGRGGLIWDHTVFHVVASCRANPAMVAPSKRNCRIAQRIARTPKRARGAAHPLVMFQECHRLAGVFAAYPSALKPSDPHRDPGPGRVDHLHHHTPVTVSDSAHNPGSQHSDHRTLCRAPEPVGCEPRSSPSKPTSRSHRSQRSSDTQQQVG